MIPWGIVGICAAAIVVLIITISVIRSRKRAKKLKLQVQKSAEKAKEISDAPKSDPVKSEPYDELSFDEPPKKEAVVSRYGPFDDIDDDEELSPEEEERYRQFMQQKMAQMRGQEFHSGQPRVIDEDEDFNNFRNEHCYSKYVTDPNLLENIKSLPPEVKTILFSNIFDRVANLDIDNKI